MTAPTLTLADFLLLRIAEDEAAAREAAEHAPGVGRWGVARDAWAAPHGKGGGPAYTGVREDVVAWHDGRAVPAWQTERHIARWDPARVLAECEAKRRIAEKHFPTEFDSEDGGYGGGGTGCPTDVFDTDDDGNCETLKLLALPYAGHPDYRADWA